MNHYANPEERARVIAGLRDLADFLHRNPQVPAPRFTDLFVFPTPGSDADSPAGHYSAVRDFGPVQYRAVAIPHTARHEDEGTE